MTALPHSGIRKSISSSGTGAQMIKRLFLAAGILGLVLSNAAAEDEGQKRIRQAVIDDTISWIKANTQYKDFGPPRFWIALTDDEMRSWALKVGSDPQATRAFYLCGTEQGLYFLARADLTDDAFLSILVHELVHHAQCVNNRISFDKCPLEREAYAVQAAFVRQRKIGKTKTIQDRYEEFAVRVEKTADFACQRLRNQ